MEVPGRRFTLHGCDEDNQTDIHCEPCEENGRHQIATGYCVDCNEFICTSCQLTHRGSKMSRHHTIMDQTNMPRQKLSSAEGNFCPKHDGKLLEYYCRDHEEFSCGVCVHLNHRQCTKVDFIREAAADFINGQQYEVLTAEIKVIMKKLAEFKDAVARGYSQVDEYHVRIVSDIGKFRDQINSMFETLEQKILEQAENFKTETIQQLERANTQCESTEKAMKAIISDLETSVKYKQDQHLLVNAKKAKVHVGSFEKHLSDYTSKYDLRVFEANDELQKILDSCQSLGKLKIIDVNEIMPKDKGDIEPKEDQSTVVTPDGSCENGAQAAVQKHVKPSSLDGKDPQTWKASFQGEIRVNIKQDKSKSYITSGIEMGDGHLVIVDNNNSCLKMVDTVKSSIKLLIQLPSKPWDIAFYRHNQYVVTGEGKLLFVNIDKVASFDRITAVAGDLRGIVYHENKFIISCAAPNPCVKLVDIDGQVVQVFQRDRNGRELFVNPWYLRIGQDGKTILVSDFENHAVIGLNMNGHVIGKYSDKNLKGPTGLSVGPGGVIVLTGRKSHNVHMLSRDCRHVQLLLHRKDGEELPQSPILCPGQEKMYISHNWRTRYSNTLSVYKLN